MQIYIIVLETPFKMAHRQQRLIHILNIMIPIGPHLARHLRFDQQLELIQQRVVDAVARELAILIAAFREDWASESDLTGSDLSGDVSIDSAVAAEDAERTIELEAREPMGNKATIVADSEDNHSVVSEGAFVAGIQRSSSPQPGPSSANHGRGLHMRGVSGGMSINSDPVVVPPSSASDSSDLPSLSLPVIQPRRGSPLQRRPHNVSHSVISISSDDVGDNLTSVSHGLPPAGNDIPPFPPPLAQVSLSEIRSASLNDSMVSATTTNDTCQEIDLRMRAVLRASERRRPRRRRYRQRWNSVQLESRARVARWLVTNDIEVHRGELGNPTNPIILRGASEDEIDS